MAGGHRPTLVIKHQPYQQARLLAPEPAGCSRRIALEYGLHRRPQIRWHDGAVLTSEVLALVDLPAKIDAVREKMAECAAPENASATMRTADALLDLGPVPLRLEAGILSRMRSPVTSRSNRTVPVRGRPAKAARPGAFPGIAARASGKAEASAPMGRTHINLNPFLLKMRWRHCRQRSHGLVQ